MVKLGIVISLMLEITNFGQASETIIERTVGELSMQRSKISVEKANSIAHKVIAILPPEAQTEIGISEAASLSLSIKRGYSDHTQEAYKNVLLELEQISTNDDELLALELKLVHSIVSNYISLMEQNRAYGRLSIFLPLTYSSTPDGIDPLEYIFDGLNQLKLKDVSQSIIGQRFQNYIIPSPSKTPLITGVIEEIENLIHMYRAGGKEIIYPNRRHLEGIIDSKKIDSMIEDIQRSLSGEYLYIIDHFREQINTYVSFVKERLLPYAPLETQIPESIYRTLLSLHGVNTSPQDLIVRAQADYKKLYDQYNQVAQEVVEEYNVNKAPEFRIMSSDPAIILQTIENASSLSEPSEIVEMYKAFQREMEDVCRLNNILTLPSKPIKMRVGNEAEELVMPVPHLNPPTFIGNDGSVSPEFVLCDVKAHGNPLVAYPLIVHEGRPGHDQQFSCMLDLFKKNQLDLIQVAIASNSANCEGWAHYVEYLMCPYFSKQAQLAAIRDQLLRQARLFLDPQLNLGLITYDQAKDFIQYNVGFPEATAKSEADRYSYRMPGQATTYRYGSQIIMDLREQLASELNDKFSMQKFHDAIMIFGLLPVDMTRDLIRLRILNS